MVLTDNQGHVKKWGIVEYGTMSWQDPSTWITYDSRQYTVSNFKLFNQSCPRPRCTDVLHFGVRYPGATMKIVENVSSYAKCKDICTGHVECKVWTFSTSDKKCRLKSKIEKISSDDGSKISGTRACSAYSSDNGGDV